MPPRPDVVRAGSEVRGTQSFVYAMALVWRRPSLTALEVLWRWAIGIPILWLLATFGWRVWLSATGGTANPAAVNLDHFTLTDPTISSLRIAAAASHILPPALHTASWLLPLLLAAWIVAATFGRAVVLRRMEPAVRPKHATLLALTAIHTAVFAAFIALWFWMITATGRLAITGPASRGEEQNLVLYFSLIIFGTLLFFIAWASTSWVLSIAPTLAVLRNLNAVQSLAAATNLGPLRGKLIEINLVMCIVKIALIVLAMVFSATPLPFQTYATDSFLYTWWAGVMVLYLLASDYFHVVRRRICLTLCRAYDLS